ncbi:hypothetical protein BDR03DRAFT_959253, partial [Suillus americanus]
MPEKMICQSNQISSTNAFHLLFDKQDIGIIHYHPHYSHKIRLVQRSRTCTPSSV